MFDIHICSLRRRTIPIIDSYTHPATAITIYPYSWLYPAGDIMGRYKQATSIDVEVASAGKRFASSLNTEDDALSGAPDTLVFNDQKYSGKILNATDISDAGRYFTVIEIYGLVPMSAYEGGVDRNFKIWRAVPSWNVSDTAIDYSRININKMFTITRGVTKATCSSTVTDGFSRATIGVRRSSLNEEIYSADMTDWLVLITSVYGIVWEGYVSSMEILGDSLSLECSGYKSKLDDVFYAGSFEAVAGSTSPVIIRDILRSLESTYESPALSIDRENVIHTPQAAAGGVGPRDYLSTTMTARSALNDILTIGAYKVADYDTLAVQVWEGRLAKTQILKPGYSSSEAQWVVTSRNIPGSSEFGYSLDRSNYYNAFSVSYRGISGQEQVSASKQNYADVEMHGVKEKLISGGDLTEGQLQLIIEAQLQDIRNSGAIGSIDVIGNVYNMLLGGDKHACMIRGGDILFVPGYGASVVPFSNGAENASVLVAGEVSCDLMNGTVSVTPYGSPDKAELIINQLEVNL